MEFILYDKSIGGWYGGSHHKYSDVFMITASIEGARVYNLKDAEKMKDYLNKKGYDFMLWMCQERRRNKN